MPLRGVLRCHCGQLLTGAPSRGKSGKYFYYYKCNATSKHNNISVIKSHDQLMSAFDYMSLPDKMIKSIILKSEHSLEERTRDRAKLLANKKSELDRVESDLHSLEKNFLAEQVNIDTYTRWHNDYTKQRNYLRVQIDQLNTNRSDSHKLLLENIGHLSDIKKVYLSVNMLHKQELVRTAFDNSLYYEKNVYRTPYIIPELAHNELIMKKKNLLIIEKKGGNFAISSSGGGDESSIEHLSSLLSVIQKIMINNKK